MSKLTPGWQKTSVLESVFDQLSDALVLYDPEFRITGVNRSAEKLFGMTSEEMLGKHCQEVFKCSGLRTRMRGSGGSEPDARRALLHGPPAYRKRHGAAGGDAHHPDVRRAAASSPGVVATIKDITEEAAPQKREVIAESAPMREVLNFVRRVAASEATTILLEGENGTGKDLIAKTLALPEPAPGRAVHRHQLRRHPGFAAGKRAVRLRKRRLHRCARAEARHLRTGR